MMENMSRKPRQKQIGWIIVTVAASILLAAVAIHFRYARRMEMLVGDQFNQEQLTVARIIQKLVEKSLNALEEELLQIAGSLPATHSTPAAWQARLQTELERISTAGVIEIRIWDRVADTVQVVSRNEIVQDASVDKHELISEPLPGPGEIQVSHPRSTGSGLHLSMITPLGSGNGQFLLFRINLSWFLSPLVKDVRSGASGYAWIIDERGRFLYHPFTDFIGRSAFEVRKENYPDQDFVEIDQIQKEEMLHGREGTGTYHSGWHRGITGRMPKLIAFCPIHVSQVPPQFWSVAVVAPAHEIASAAAQIHRWQLMLQLLVTAVVAVAATVVYLFEIRFSGGLEKLVESRTAALKRSEEK
jgi:hypothetical protein